MRKLRARLRRNNLREKIFDNTITISSLFSSDQDLIKMREGFTQVAIFNQTLKEFYELFNKGRELYYKGDWLKARTSFEKLQVY